MQARFLISSLFNDSLPINLTGKVVLELGSGTGIAASTHNCYRVAYPAAPWFAGVVGIAAGFCQTKAVILTDLPDLLPTINRNIAEAQSSHSALSSVLSSQSLDW
jgi:Lysine methyltransferase